MTMEDFKSVADLVTPDTWARLKAYGRPYCVGGVDTPKDLYHLTFGELVEAQGFAKNNDVEGLCCMLLNITSKQYNKASASEIMAFAYWSTRELEKIGKLFSSLDVKPTPEQIKAGINKLKHGLFGTLDWYCLRMGITNHEEAENVKWIIIYKCMKKDRDENDFKNRLSKIYEQQQQQQMQQRRARK